MRSIAATLGLLVLAAGCATPPSPDAARRAVENSGLERIWIEALGLE